MPKIIIIAHDIRSTHNVGSLMRTAEGLGIDKIYLTGYTPHPVYEGDNRLPHLALKNHNKIAKTALGAEKSTNWEYREDVLKLISELRGKDFTISALEQSPKSVPLQTYRPDKNVAIILGSEVTGVEKRLLDITDTILEIPMFGDKESFNVTEAATMVMYHLRFYSK